VHRTDPHFDELLYSAPLLLASVHLLWAALWIKIHVCIHSVRDKKKEHAIVCVVECTAAAVVSMPVLQDSSSGL
jgi:hypothetical protein